VTQAFLPVLQTASRENDWLFFYLNLINRCILLIHMKRKSVSYWDHIPPETSMVGEPETAYMIDKVRDGLPFAEFQAMREMLGLTEERLGALLGMSRATLHRRKKLGTLDRAESDRLVRYGRLLSHATAALGGIEGARSWLVAPAIAFRGECPLDYADTEIGAREVDALLGRLEHGVFS
jgi:putative toxin-antitoxin system antitoxin component (TIGR02293 family)